LLRITKVFFNIENNHEKELFQKVVKSKNNVKEKLHKNDYKAFYYFDSECF